MSYPPPFPTQPDEPDEQEQSPLVPFPSLPLSWDFALLSQLADEAAGPSVPQPAPAFDSSDALASTAACFGPPLPCQDAPTSSWNVPHGYLEAADPGEREQHADVPLVSSSQGLKPYGSATYANDWASTSAETGTNAVPDWYFPPPTSSLTSRSATQSSSASSLFDPRSHGGHPTAYTPYFPSSSSLSSTAVEPIPDDPESPTSIGSADSPEVDFGLEEDELRRKERRKATNRASARAFRERQKASLDLHKALLEERDAEVSRLRAEVARLSGENTSLERQLYSSQDG